MLREGATKEQKRYISISHKWKVRINNYNNWGIVMFFYAVLSVGWQFETTAQALSINEVQSSNVLTVFDEDRESSDWIEIFNPGPSPVNLLGYGLSDTSDFENKWVFPDFQLGPEQYLLVFASDKNKSSVPLNWWTVIDRGDPWKYKVPEAELPATWKAINFDDSGWLNGKTSIGYGDGDDSTLVSGALSVFMRKTFNVVNPEYILEAALHVDYDDGFVAYINGIMVARSDNMPLTSPPFDATTDYDHEAVIFTGGFPEKFVIDNPSSILLPGENVLSIQVHNASETSFDMTIIPILSLGSSQPADGPVSEHLEFGFDNLHTDFKISSEGETIYLTNDLNQVVDSLFTGPLTTDISIGRTPDGSDAIAYFIEATPGMPNETQAYLDFSHEVEFSHPGGIYNSAILLSLSSADSTENIHYTMDGSIPAETSNLYEGPITINNKMVLRARSIKAGSIPGKINSQSYLLNVNHELPIVSLSVDPEQMFDNTTGMYSLGPSASPNTPNFGANFWEEREIPGHVEFYETDGSQAFSVNVGVRIFGGWSRAFPQKSLSLHAKKAYGDGEINYRIFSDKAIDTFRTIVLRNSGNDWNTTMFRDGLMTSLFNELVDRQAYRPAVLYINGQYWGIQNIREKVNEHFIYDNHGIAEKNINILEGSGSTVFGDEDHYISLVNFIQNNDLQDNNNYAYVKNRMDVLNFICYQTGQIFMDNTDWPGNNIKFWRDGNPWGKWKWIVYDTDFGFGLYDDLGFMNNTLEFATDPSGPSWPNPPWSTFLLRKLLENTEFKNLFINTFADQLNTNFSAENIVQKINATQSAIASEIGNHFNRWGSNSSAWESRVDDMINFGHQRPNYIREFIKDKFNISNDYLLKLNVSSVTNGKIKVNTVVPNNYPWNGTYFSGIPITVKALPSPGYRFVRWEGDVTGTNTIIQIAPTSATNLTAIFEPHIPDLNSVVINEVNYNPSADKDAGDWVELYNNSSTTIDMSNWILKDDDDEHKFEFPNGTILYANDYLVVVRDTDAFLTFHSPLNWIGELDFGLSGDGDCIRLFDQQDQLVDFVCYGNDLPWPPEANGQGSTLALRSPNDDNSLSENWYALGNGGNPGINNNIPVSGLKDKLLNNSLRIYPNPVHGEANIKFDIIQPGRTELFLYDQNGKCVNVIMDKILSTGFHNIRWDLNPNLGNGLFYLKLKSPGHLGYAKFIIAK